jgi:hypothetical protein
VFTTQHSPAVVLVGVASSRRLWKLAVRAGRPSPEIVQMSAGASDASPSGVAWHVEV